MNLSCETDYPCRSPEKSTEVFQKEATGKVHRSRDGAKGAAGDMFHCGYGHVGCGKAEAQAGALINVSQSLQKVNKEPFLGFDLGMGREDERPPVPVALMRFTRSCLADPLRLKGGILSPHHSRSDVNYRATFSELGQE